MVKDIIFKTLKKKNFFFLQIPKLPKYPSTASNDSCRTHKNASCKTHIYLGGLINVRTVLEEISLQLTGMG